VRDCATCRVHAAREFELLPLWFYVIELVGAPMWALADSAAAEAVASFTHSVQMAAGLLSASTLALQGSLWDSFGKEPPPPLQQPAMQLAARAVLLYLAHALDAKEHHSNAMQQPLQTSGMSAPLVDGFAGGDGGGGGGGGGSGGGGGGGGAAAGSVSIDLSSRSARAETRALGTALLRCAQQPAYRMGFEGFFSSMTMMLSRPAPTPLSEFKKEVVRTLLPMAPYLAGL